MFKTKYVFLLFVLALTVGGCAKTTPQVDPVERQGEQFREQSRSRTVEVVETPYLGAKATMLRSTASNPILNKRVMLRRKGTLTSIAAAISELSSLSVQVAADQDEAKKSTDHPPVPPASAPAAPSGEQGVNLELEALLKGGGNGGSGVSVVGYGGGKVLNVSYEGPLRGLLDQVAALSGYGWDFDENNNSVTFAHMLVRTYTILGAPGKVTYENKLTNKSKENSSPGISNSLVSQPVSREDTSAQTSQTSGTTLTFDVWADTEKAVKALLTPKGVVVVNQAAGTITVRDIPESVRRVGTYIDELNTRLSRQVALTVRVWSLKLTDDAEIGFNIQTLFQNANVSDVALSAGSISGIGSINTATATIVSGRLKDSSAVLKALRQWGKATQVTSAGGLVMSNQPVPVLAIERRAYLAGVGKSTNDYSQTTEITPGEVTTGFAMTVIPHILDQRRVILQYNINISALDEMKELTTSDVTVELPQTSTRALSQRSAMKMGQTLVLCGFEKESTTTDNALGITKTSHSGSYGRSLLVITIEVESAEL
ncbi:MAG TPA: pilus assembly protein [Solidesulfovibrio magneticus]|nr:pilus assembly protein [Solidesulfovibrio magneticus]